jgi:hypothetical protein
MPPTFRFESSLPVEHGSRDAEADPNGHERCKDTGILQGGPPNVPLLSCGRIQKPKRVR